MNLLKLYDWYIGTERNELRIVPYYLKNNICNIS